LVGALYRSRTGADALAKQADALQTVATRLGVAGAAPATSETPRDTTAKEMALELQKTATMLDDAQVGIGWQNSWITKRWCVYRGACTDAGPAPTAGRLAVDVMLWLLGLVLSCVMLSLGAPFWVSTMSSLINLQNAVQGEKQGKPKDDAKKPPY
jgi:hypothetical protein